MTRSSIASTVAGERPLPGRDRVRVPAERREHVTQVILHDGVERQLRGRFRELLPRVLVAMQLEVGPSEAIEVGAVAGSIGVPDRSTDRFVEPLPASASMYPR